MAVLNYNNQIDYEIVEFNSLDSTNEEVKRLIKKGSIADRTVITSQMQTSGNGRGLNLWKSDKGNLYLSLAIKITLPIHKAANYSFVTALSIGNTISDFINDESFINYKWPNDVLVKGRKVSGVLLETLKDANNDNWLIVGVGVNINNAPQMLDNKAISVSSLRGTRLDVVNFRDEFLRSFSVQENLWKNKGFSCIRTAWLNKAYKLGEVINVNLPNSNFKGIFKGITDNGELVVSVNDKIHQVSSGEVFF